MKNSFKKPKRSGFTPHLECPALVRRVGSSLPQGLMPCGQGAGFTLIELAVAITIFVLVTALVLESQTEFNDNIGLTNLAYDVALLIRQAQIYGMSVRPANFTDFNQAAYGVHFDILNRQAFTLFADLNGDGAYRADAMLADCSGECVTLYKVPGSVIGALTPKGNQVSRICATTSAGVEECSSALIDTVEIMFHRPRPESIIKAYRTGDARPVNYVSAAIVLSSPSGATRAVCVYYTGEISVKRQVGVSNFCN